METSALASSNVIALPIRNTLPKHDKIALDQVLAFAKSIARQIN